MTCVFHPNSHVHAHEHLKDLNVFLQCYKKNPNVWASLYRKTLSHLQGKNSGFVEALVRLVGYLKAGG